MNPDSINMRTENTPCEGETPCPWWTPVNLCPYPYLQSQTLGSQQKTTSTGGGNEVPPRSRTSASQNQEGPLGPKVNRMSTWSAHARAVSSTPHWTETQDLLESSSLSTSQI